MPGNSAGATFLSFSPVTDPLLVTQGNGSPLYPDVARAADGDFVAVWDGETAIFARRYNADGTPKAGQFVVGANTTEEYEPRVAMSTSGDFVVAWSLEDTSGRVRTWAATFTSAGAQRQLPFQVSTGSADAWVGGVGMDQAGNFTVVWSATGGHDPDDEGVFARRYDLDGNQLGTPGSITQVNATTEGRQHATDVAVNEAGNPVVVYHHDATPDSASQVGRVYARRLAGGTGTPSTTGSEITVDSYVSIASIASPRVDVADDGSFAVAYRDGGTVGDDLFVRTFDPVGTARGSAFEMHGVSGQYDFLWDADVALSDSGARGVLAWIESSSLHHGAQVRVFDLDSPDGTQGEVDDAACSAGAVAMAPDDAFAVNYLDTCTGRSSNNLYARLYAFGGGPPPDAPPGTSFPRSSQMDPGGGFGLDGHCPPQLLLFCSFDVSGDYDLLGASSSGTRSLGRRTFRVASGEDRRLRFVVPAAALREARLRGSLRVRLITVATAGPHRRTSRATVTLHPRQTRAVADAAGRVRVRVHFPRAVAGGRARVQLRRGRRVSGQATVPAVAGGARVVTIRLGALERAALRAGRSQLLTVSVFLAFAGRGDVGDRARERFRPLLVARWPLRVVPG